jgi:hypothetical protein
MQRANLSQYFDEVVHLGSSEETLEMSPWIGPSVRDDPLLGMDHRLGMIDGSDDILDSDEILGSDASLDRDDPRFGWDPQNESSDWTLSSG